MGYSKLFYLFIPILFPWFLNKKIKWIRDIWRARKDCIFNNAVMRWDEVVEDIKVLSWKWALGRLNFQHVFFTSGCGVRVTVWCVDWIVVAAVLLVRCCLFLLIKESHGCVSCIVITPFYLTQLTFLQEYVLLEFPSCKTRANRDYLWC